MTSTINHRMPTPPECTSLIHTLAETRAKLIRQRNELNSQLRELSNQLDRLDWQLSSLQISQEWLISVARHPSNQFRQQDHARSDGVSGI